MSDKIPIGKVETYSFKESAISCISSLVCLNSLVGIFLREADGSGIFQAFQSVNKKRQLCLIKLKKIGTCNKYSTKRMDFDVVSKRRMYTGQKSSLNWNQFSQVTLNIVQRVSKSFSWNIDHKFRYCHCQQQAWFPSRQL